MPTTISMPQLGESVAEGTIGKWLKEPGDRVERDEPIVEVITDKVNAEIPSPVAGVIERIVVPEGQTVPVGAELAVIGDQAATPAGERPPSGRAADAGPSTASPRPVETTPEERVPQGPSGAAEAAAPVAIQGDDGDGLRDADESPNEHPRLSDGSRASTEWT